MLRRYVPACGFALLACREAPPPTPDSVGEWARVVATSVAREQLAAPVASRIHAYTAIAIYEAHAADRASGLRSLAGQLNGLWHVPMSDRHATLDGAIVAAEAARLVLDAFLSEASHSTKASIDTLHRSQIARRLSEGVSRSVGDRSRAHGKLVARDILAWAATDGFTATRNRPWRAPEGYGKWAPPRATGPNIVLAGAPDADRAITPKPRIGQLALEPHWGRLRNFVLRYGDECEPPRAPDVAPMERELRDSLAALTADQRAIAAFWADSGTLRTAGHWASITDRVMRRTPDAGRAAEVYMFSSVAQADVYIAAWKEKYRSMVSRPRAAAHVDSPEYPAEGAAVAGAVTNVFARLVGDSVSFSHNGRTFQGILGAGREAAMASVYAGAQFVPSVTEGLAQGRCVASRVLGRLKTR